MEHRQSIFSDDIQSFKDCNWFAIGASIFSFNSHITLVSIVYKLAIKCLRKETEEAEELGFLSESNNVCNDQ